MRAFIKSVFQRPGTNSEALLHHVSTDASMTDLGSPGSDDLPQSSADQSTPFWWSSTLRRTTVGVSVLALFVAAVIFGVLWASSSSSSSSNHAVPTSSTDAAGMDADEFVANFPGEAALYASLYRKAQRDAAQAESRTPTAGDESANLESTVQSLFSSSASGLKNVAEAASRQMVASTTSFRNDWAVCYAQLANASYYPYLYDDVLSQQGLVLVQNISDASSGVAGFVAVFQDASGSSLNHIIVAFRGTVPSILVNDLEDADLYDWNPFSSGKTAQGFTNAYDSVHSQVIDGINNAISYVGAPASQIRVDVIGHSLGGALAVLASSQLYGNGMLNSFGSFYLYTFASPRVGDTNFANQFNNVFSNVWMVEAYYDIIPHLPPSLFGFHQVRTRLLVGPSMGESRVISKTSNHLALPPGVSSTWDLFNGSSDMDIIFSYHRIGHYIEMLGSLADAPPDATPSGNSCPYVSF